MANGNRHIHFAIAALFVLAMFILCRESWAADSVHYVESLPVTFTQSDHSGSGVDTIKFGQDTTIIKSTGSGINMSPSAGDLHDWYILFEDDTLVYANAAAANTVYGISFTSAGINECYDVTIGGTGYIIENLEFANTIDTVTYDAADETAYHHNVGVMFTGFAVHDLTMDGDITIISRGYDSRPVRLGGWGNHLVKNVTLIDNSPGYDNRGDFEGSTIMMTGWKDSILVANGYSYHAKIESTTCLNCAHTCIYGIPNFYSRYWYGDDSSETPVGHCPGDIAGNCDSITTFIDSMKIIVDNCSLEVDARNIKYRDACGGGGVEQGRANAYGVHFTYAGPGTEITDNIMTAGSQHHGGRGIQFDRGTGNATYPMLVSGNTVLTHEDADVCFTGAYGYFPTCIKIRNQTRWCNVFNNTFISTVDGSVAYGTITGGYYPYGHAGVYEQLTFDITQVPPFNIHIDSNLFRLVDRNSGTGAYADAFNFQLNYNYDVSSSFIGNRLESDYMGITFSSYDGYARKVVMREDTIKLTDTSNTDHLTFRIGHLSNTWPGDSIYAIDFVFETALSDTDITIQSLTYPADIHLVETIKTFVLDTLGAAIVSCTVLIINDSTDTVFNQITNGSGYVEGEVEWLIHSRPDGSGEDIHNYDPHNRILHKGTLDTNMVFVVRDYETQDTVYGLGAPAPAITYIKFQGIKLKGIRIIQ